MILKSNKLNLEIGLTITALLLLFNLSGSGQGLTISSGTILFAPAGNIVLQGNVTNNGSWVNQNSTVIFSGNTQILNGTYPISFNNIIVAPGGTTTITTSGQSLAGILLCNSTLNSNGNLTLLSSDSRTAIIDGSGTGEVNGKVTMQRYLSSGFGYKYFSSPFKGATVSEFGDEIDLGAYFPMLFRYDESRTSSGWVRYTDPGGKLNPMEGYSVNFGSMTEPKTADLSGEVNNGNLSLPLYNHNNAFTTGFNLVGNPYPSPIDWDAPEGWTRTNIDDAIYYFKASNTDQYGGTYSTYLDGVSSDGLATSIIPSMQGFFVHVTDGLWPVEGSLALNNDVRKINLTQPFVKSGSKGAISYVRFEAGYSDNAESFDPAVIYLDPNATCDFDGKYDAYKILGNDSNKTNFYTFGCDSSMLSINCLPSAGDDPYRVRLGLKTEKDADIIFRIRDLLVDFPYRYISILDVVTGVNQDLLNGHEYRINLKTGHYQHRFYLILSDALKTTIDHIPGDDGFNVYSSRGILKVEISLPITGSGILTIYNLLGQAIFQYKIPGPGSYEFDPAIKDGIYIVTFRTGNREIPKRIFIREN